jgi:hypothetical protein
VRGNEDFHCAKNCGILSWSLNLTAIPQGSYDKSHGPYGASRGVMKP